MKKVKYIILLLMLGIIMCTCSEEVSSIVKEPEIEEPEIKKNSEENLKVENMVRDERIELANRDRKKLNNIISDLYFALSAKGYADIDKTPLELTDKEKFYFLNMLILDRSINTTTPIEESTTAVSESLEYANLELTKLLGITFSDDLSSLNSVWYSDGYFNFSLNNSGETTPFSQISEIEYISDNNIVVEGESGFCTCDNIPIGIAKFSVDIKLSKVDNEVIFTITDINFDLDETTIPKVSTIDNIPEDKNDVVLDMTKDYDNDGTYETFRFRGTYSEDEFVYTGTLYYIKDELETEVLSENMYWYVDKYYEAPNKKCCLFLGGYVGTGTNNIIYTVENNKPVEVKFPGAVSGVKVQGGELMVLQDRYDMSSDGSGNTWKYYYLYMNDEGLFREYGGAEITLDKFMSLDGAHEILDLVAERNGSLTNIIYRSNGIININYVRDNNINSNITAKYVDNKVIFIETNDGIYDIALYPEIADYPDINAL